MLMGQGSAAPDSIRDLDRCLRRYPRGNGEELSPVPRDGGRRSIHRSAVPYRAANVSAANVSASPFAELIAGAESFACERKTKTLLLTVATSAPPKPTRHVSDLTNKKTVPTSRPSVRRRPDDEPPKVA
jgi:hypothetical protein